MEQNMIIQQEAIAAEHSQPIEELAKILNRVIAKAINSREEFLTFAGKAESRSLHELCMQTKTRRDDFALRLQRKVSALGHAPATDENFTGWIHHVWTRARLKLESESDYVIASEAMREEESMKLALTEAMTQIILPGDIHADFEKEIIYCEELHAMMSRLKDRLKPDDFVDVNKD